MNKTLAITIIIFSVTCQLHSQYKKGYIIGNENDTTWGYINFEGSIRNSDHCNFISMPDSTLHKYYPGEIKAFRFLDSKYFSTEEVKAGNETKKVFLEWLIKGRASILTYTQENTKTRYFIIPENEPLRELVNTLDIIERNGDTFEHYKKEYVGDLKYYFKDCPEIYKEIETTPFNSKPLINIAKEYHERTCKTGDCIIFEDKDRQMHFEIGGSVSYLFSRLKLHNGLPEKSQMTGSPGGGIEMRFSNLPLISPKFSFSGQVIYYNVLYSYDTLTVYVKDHRMFGIQYLRVPVHLDYKFTHSRLSPFISAGMTFDIRMSYKEYDHYLVNLVTEHYDYLVGLSRFQWGLNSGIGLIYNVNPKISVKLFGEYEYGFRFFGAFQGDKSNNNDYFIQTSVLFHLK
jgi:hypothetical protein